LATDKEASDALVKVTKETPPPPPSLSLSTPK
jgi:hypothetical protein